VLHEVVLLEGADMKPPHCWRHWFTSKLVEDNEDLVKIQKKLSHEIIATTAKYLHELVGI
jgi:site-specific recombinase XerD